MDSSQIDLPGKYQKLATEYAKMRAQVNVLKKAIFEEKDKNSSFQTELKEKDQSNRKFEQEMESLTFRNQQLTKRIIVLQDEFEEVNRNKKGKNKSSGYVDVSPGANVVTEELQHKIEENAELHKKIHELDTSFTKTVQDLQSKIETFERNSLHFEGTLNRSEEKSKATIEKLTKDKARLELRLQTDETTLKESILQAEICKENLESVEGELNSKLSSANKVLRDRVLFNDSKASELNSLNIPTINCSQQKAIKKLIFDVSDNLNDLTTALSNFHTYNEQRIKIFYADQTLTPVNSKFIELLHNNVLKLKPIVESFSLFQNSLSNNFIISMETIHEFPQFFKSFADYCTYWNILLPYHLLSIQEECALSSCSPSLESKNMELYDSLLILSRLFNKVYVYLEFISFQCICKTNFRYPESSQSHVLQLLSMSLIALHNAFKDVWKHFNNKISIEHLLPTVSEELKRTNECILSSLISLVNCVGKISNLLQENLSVVCQGLIYKAKGSSDDLIDSEDRISIAPAVLGFQERARNYLSLLDEDEPVSVPYEEALQNKEVLDSSTESREGLAKQLRTMQEKVHKLEQAKEHWMLEFQLLEIKHERDLKKLNELEANNPNSNQNEQMEQRVHRNSSAAVPLSKVGNLSRNECDIVLREEEMKSYFTTRINELVTDMQLADSKAVCFQTECASLQKKLVLSDDIINKLQNELTETKTEISGLQDELQLTSNNYKVQLNTMSEHLANLNETLTSQTDEIDNLKFQLKQKGNKKGKLK